MSPSSPLRRDAGQATLEFALVIMLFLGFAFFFVKLALVLGWASYIQYATYLSARSFVSAGATVAEMDARARTVSERMLRRGGEARAPFLASDDGDQTFLGIPVRGEGFQENSRDWSWKEGVRYKFKTRIAVLPFGQQGLGPDDRYLRLLSEAWLGREPADAECAQQLSEAQGYFDNGC